MKLILAAEHQILLELTAQELQCYALEDQTAEEGGLRAALQQILSRVADKTGRCFCLRRHVRADILPDRAGGCLLIVSGVEEPGAVTRRFCFFAETENELLDAARAVCAAAQQELNITLLKSRNGYLLLTPPLPDGLVRLLSEYMSSTKLDETAEAALLEQCVLLLKEKPLSALCGGT